MDEIILTWQLFTQGGGGGTPYNGLNAGRLRPKGVPFSGWRYIKGQGFDELKGWENDHLGLKWTFKISRTDAPKFSVEGIRKGTFSIKYQK